MYEHPTFASIRLTAHMVASPSTAVSPGSVEILLSLMSAEATANEYVVANICDELFIEQMPRTRVPQ